MNLLTIFLLFSALLLTRISNLRLAINILVMQSGMIALVCLAVGWETGAVHTYIAAVLTAIIKAGIIPFILFRIVFRLRREREMNPILSPNYSVIAAGLAIVLSYSLIDKVLPGMDANRDALASAVALTLIGLLLIMTRRQAIMQIVGLITMENGLYLLGLSTTKGFPLIIELGIFFDVMVAVAVLVLLTYRLKISFLSTDTSKLIKLKG